MKVASTRFILESFAAAMLAACAMAEAAAQPALVRYGGEILLVRNFNVPYVPATGFNPLAPRVEPMEYQLRFRGEDVRVFRIDGTPVDPDSWQATFAKETAVRFSGYAIRGPDEPVVEPKVGLPANEQQVYRKDTLIVTGVRSPVSQKPMRPGKDFPRGSAPRHGVASLAGGGRLRVVETVTTRAHYPARRDSDENRAENHIFKTMATTITIDVRLVDVDLRYANGTRIAGEATAEAIGEDTPVLISADGSPVDPFFLRLMRPGTVVVAIPQPTFNQPRVPPFKKGSSARGS